MNGVYNIIINTPMGVEAGRLTLFVREGDKLSGILSIIGCETDFTGGKIFGNKFEFEGELHKILEKYYFTAKGTINGDTLKGEADTKFGKLPITGTRIK